MSTALIRVCPICGKRSPATAQRPARHQCTTAAPSIIRSSRHCFWRAARKASDQAAAARTSSFLKVISPKASVLSSHTKFRLNAFILGKTPGRNGGKSLISGPISFRVIAGSGGEGTRSGIIANDADHRHRRRDCPDENNSPVRRDRCRRDSPAQTTRPGGGRKLKRLVGCIIGSSLECTTPFACLVADKHERVPPTTRLTGLLSPMPKKRRSGILLVEART